MAHVHYANEMALNMENPTFTAHSEIRRLRSSPGSVPLEVPPAVWTGVPGELRGLPWTAHTSAHTRQLEEDLFPFLKVGYN